MLYQVVLSLILAALFLPVGTNFLIKKNLGIQSLIKTSLAPQRIRNNSLGIETTAKSFVILDGNSQTVLLDKNSQLILPIASITKLMAALVFLEHNPDWQKVVKIIKDDRRQGGIIYLYNNEKVKVLDLFYLMLIASANEATMALIRSTGLDLKNFVDLMNQKARILGMTDTTFVEPTGLSPLNTSSADDLIKLAQVAFSQPEIKKALLTKTYQFKILNSNRRVYISNTDKLLDSFLNDPKEDYQILGAKTGYLEEGGYCLLISVKNYKGQNLIIALLGSETEKDRWQEAKGLVDWVFRNYQWPE